MQVNIHFVPERLGELPTQQCEPALSHHEDGPLHAVVAVLCLKVEMQVLVVVAPEPDSLNTVGT